MSERVARTLAPVALAVLLSACPRQPDPDDAFRRELLRATAEQVILPTYLQFRDATAALHEATAALTTAAATGPADPELSAARAAFLETMVLWQRAELHQVGPAGPPATFTGGQALRDEIYSWPTVNPCRVDQELVAQGYTAPDFFDVQLVNVYGLDALEYLLFQDGPENQCPSLSDINTSGAWAALGPDTLRARRAAYAHAVAGQVRADAQTLYDAWAPTGGDFAQSLAEAGTGEGSVYGTAQQALDELFAAMFYLDLDTKDDKLATPAGLSLDCPAANCPHLVESRWAHASNQYIVANLEGFRALFVGNLRDAPAQPGFDDFLVRRNAEPLAQQLLQRIDAATAAVQAIPVPLEEAVQSHPTEVAAAHTAIKQVTDLLKSQFITVLNLRVPQEGAADND